MDLWPIFIAAFVLEVVFCAIPGPVTAEAFRRGMGGGFRPSLLVQLGSFIGDLFWAVIALVGLAFLFESIPVRLALGLFGAGFMLYLAWSAVQEARRGGLPEAPAGTAHGDFMTGAALSLSNPFQVVFWLGIGATTIAALAPYPGGQHYAVFMVGFFLAGLLWCFIFAYVVSVGRRFVRPRTFQVIELVCAVFLTYLGITLLWSTLQSAGLV